MRLEKYLTEKFFNATQVRGKTREVFINPSTKELKELVNDFGWYGFRFIVDVPKKNLYIANSDIFHREMMEDVKLRSALKFEWIRYWYKGEGTDRIFMGDCSHRMNGINSDSLDGLSKLLEQPYVEGTIEKLKKLQSLDFGWLSKYGFNPKEIALVIINGTTNLEYRR